MTTEIKKWHCYIDEIDDTHIHLVMKDGTDEKEGTETQGAFPKKLFDHIEDVKRGMYIDVQVLSDETIVISPVVPSEEQLAKAEVFTQELLEMLEELRGDNLPAASCVDKDHEEGD